jgi:hypothetical protein
VLLLFGVALILNVSTSAAANVATDQIAPKVTAVDPVNKAIILNSKPVKVTFNEPIKAGNKWIELRNCAGNVISTKNTISGNTVTVTPTKPLPKTFKYKLIFHSGSITDMSGNGMASYSTSFTVSKLSYSQMKDGLSRAQKFFINNGRLPTTVKFGTYKMPIAEFQNTIATQGLKINTKIAVTSNASLATIMKSAARFGYSGRAHTGPAMERIGSGDCWAMSDYLYKHMAAAGMKARIIQYATAYSSRHRSVQYLSNGAWVNAPYRTYGLNSMFNNTKSSGCIIACNV